MSPFCYAALVRHARVCAYITRARCYADARCHAAYFATCLADDYFDIAVAADFAMITPRHYDAFADAVAAAAITPRRHVAYYLIFTADDASLLPFLLPRSDDFHYLRAAYAFDSRLMSALMLLRGAAR